MDELRQGWLSPSGEFWQCASYEHFSMARSLLGDDWAAIPVRPRRQPDDALLDLGWCSIGIYSFLRHEWRISWRHHLTPEQIAFLRPYFEQPVWGIAVNESDAERWREEVHDD